MKKTVKSYKNYWYYLLLIAIVALGIFLRLKGFLSNPSLWHDEAALAWNVLHKDYLDFFQKLRFLQIAPPLFMILTKLLVQVTNSTTDVSKCDMIMRTIPLGFGILSIGLFYQICKRALISKKATLFAMLLFSINQVLINYSFEFKQYSADVFFTLLIISLFQNIDFDNLSNKNIIVKASIISISIWLSFASIFAIFAEFLILITSKWKQFKKIFAIFAPFAISFGLYFYFYLLNTYQTNKSGMLNYWDNHFVLPNFSNFLPLFVDNLRYFFTPSKWLLFILILTIYGVIIFFKEKKYNFIFTSILIFLASVLVSIPQIYPFSQRLIIFLIPLFIILISKPLDEINVEKKIKSGIIILITLAIIIPQIIGTVVIVQMPTISKGSYTKEMMPYMTSKIKRKDKIFVTNGALPDYKYYSSFYNIKNKTILNQTKKDSDKVLNGYLNSLNGNVWFFLGDQGTKSTSTKFIKSYLKKYGITKYSNGTQRSMLIYAKLK